MYIYIYNIYTRIYTHTQQSICIEKYILMHFYIVDIPCSQSQVQDSGHHQPQKPPYAPFQLLFSSRVTLLFFSL